jgi:hypothetical protein
VGTAIAVAFACSSARADDKPWAVGVTAENKAAAQQHLDAGNALFLERKYSEALEEYKQALALWEHPAIRFNMVRCLIFLDRKLEASDNLKLALKYGAQPFDDTIYSEAMSYEKLLASEIGEIEIHCEQTGVDLTMDGQALLACPGKDQRRVLPGQHQIVGKKQGFVPRTVEVVVLGGKHDFESITLQPLSKAARIEHRWATWLPWTVFGGGFAAAGIGGLLHLKASSDNSSYASYVSTKCPDGCPSGTLDHSLLTSARVENGFAVALIGVGATAVVTGSVMLYLNRGQTVYETAPATAHLDVIRTRGGAAVTWTGGF